MKHFKQTVLTLGLAAATSLFLTGCNDGSHAKHDDAHDGHEHASETAKTAGATTASAMAIIEKPTAEQIAAAKAYPLATCVVSGEKLGSMGDPLVLVFGGQQIKLCCKNCVPDFKKEPAKYVAKLTATQ